MAKTKKLVQVVTHYYVDDDNQSGDYASVSVDIDGIEVASYGDYYHDKGKQKAEGFVDALFHIYGKKNLEIKYIEISDTEE